MQALILLRSIGLIHKPLADKLRSLGYRSPADYDNTHHENVVRQVA
jgi:hypothetical protein